MKNQFTGQSLDQGRSLAEDQHSSNRAHTKSKGPGLSLNRAAGPVGVGGSSR